MSISPQISSTVFFLTFFAAAAFILLVYLIRSKSKISPQGKKAKEDALNLQNLVDAIPIPIFYKDLQGRYLGCNLAFEEVLGKSREEIVGRTVYEVAPSDLAAVYHKA